MKKNIVKIVLDISMFVLLLLMYRKDALGISFHEVGGLIVCGLVLVHLGLNWRWVFGVGRRLFGKTLSVKTRIGYLVDALLFISTAFVAVSGIMISKTIHYLDIGQRRFLENGPLLRRRRGLVLLGVHIGLHWPFIRNFFARFLRLPRIVARPLGIICLAAILIYGGYSMAESNFAGWLSGPFTASALSEGYGGGGGGGPMGRRRADRGSF